jgi:HprK-related kinase A
LTPTCVSSLSQASLTDRLRGDGIFLDLRPFVARIRSPIPIVAEGIAALYAEHQLLEPGDTFADFHVSVEFERHIGKKLCVFKIDGFAPFTPLAAGEAYAFLEWGLNWCVTTHCHKWLAIHAAVLERDGRALILPAPPGSGKSTLCAALVLNGWRLLSDEMALLDPTTGLITPAPRPVSLKNQSIDIIRQLAPDAVIGPVAHDTMKGDVAHMRVPAQSLRRANEPALPAWVVFPQYTADAPATLTPRGKAMAFMQFAENSFNQATHGQIGFHALSDLIARSDCYDFSYGHLADALRVFAELPLPP